MDNLFLVKPGFRDPESPGTVFYCWHCALIEGVLGSFPQLGQNLTVERIDWPRPRTPVIAVAGVQNQSVPLLVLGEGETSPLATGQFKGRSLIADKDAILRALTERHGFPEPHP